MGRLYLHGLVVISRSYHKKAIKMWGNESSRDRLWARRRCTSILCEHIHVVELSSLILTNRQCWVVNLANLEIYVVVVDLHKVEVNEII